jgi:pyruvate dehydrogenase (quinone)
VIRSGGLLMKDTLAGVGTVGRRGFIQLAAAGAGLVGGLSAAVAQRSESTADITRQPNPSFGDDLNTADIVLETPIAWGATHVFGVVRR